MHVTESQHACEITVSYNTIHIVVRDKRMKSVRK